MPAGTGVNVVVRVRPPLPRELGSDNAVEVLSDKEVLLYKSQQEFASSYDAVLGENASQEDTYQTVRSCVTSAMAGYNNTVITYGQTGTGKTHTMMGQHGVDVCEADSSKRQRCLGIIPRALRDIFHHIQGLETREKCLVNVVVSYMEVYQDRLYDLLQPYKKSRSTRDPLDVQQRKHFLEVREDANGATFIPGLVAVKAKTEDAVLQIIAKGNRNRAVRHTEMNISSSRSHAVLQMVVEQWPDSGRSGQVLRSKLNFVDLAGSERWNTQVTMAAERINEMTSINSSLLALAGVVAALTEGSQHVPYRTSKLTHLLQDSLGGNCQTCIIATLSPSVTAYDESVSTLKFADRVSAIGNNPVLNVSRDMNSVLQLKEREIQRLRRMLESLTAEAGPSSDALAAASAEFGTLSGGTCGGSDMTAELENLRKALESERSRNADLELRLQRAHHLGAAHESADGSCNLLAVDSPSASSAGLVDSQPHGVSSPIRMRTAGSTMGRSGMARQSHLQVPSQRSSGVSPPRRPGGAKGSNVEAAIAAIRARISELSSFESASHKRTSSARVPRQQAGLESWSSKRADQISRTYATAKQVPGQGRRSPSPQRGRGRSASPGSPGARASGTAVQRQPSILSAGLAGRELQHNCESTPSSPASSMALPSLSSRPTSTRASGDGAAATNMRIPQAAAAAGSPMAGGGWGRSSVRTFTDEPLQMAEAVSDSQQTHVPSSWGRSALLAGSGGALPSPTHSLPSHTWGRSALLAHQQTPEQAMSDPMTEAEHRSVSCCASAERPRSTHARSSLGGTDNAGGFGRSTIKASPASVRPGLSRPDAKSVQKLDQGSLIYILGPNASSVKARAVAGAISIDAKQLAKSGLAV